MVEKVIVEDKEFKKYIKRIADSNRKRNVILRGILSGIFTAIGATIGFGLLLFISSALVTNLKQVPIIDRLLTETKLDALIEKQLNEINNTENQNEEQDQETDSTYYLNYSNKQFDLEFNYPASLTNLSEYITQTEDPNKPTYVIDINGYGIINHMYVYVNYTDFNIEGESKSYNIKDKDGKDHELKVYENQSYSGSEESSILWIHYVKEETQNSYDFVAIGDKNSPKLAREIMIALAESIK